VEKDTEYSFLSDLVSDNSSFLSSSLEEVADPEILGKKVSF